MRLEIANLTLVRVRLAARPRCVGCNCPQWVEGHRTVNLNVRCNRGAGNLQLTEPTDTESSQNLFKISNKASVTEKEMCAYNINIPSVYGCPVTATDVQESAFRSAIETAETIVLVALLAAGLVAAVQVYRNRKRVSLLVPLIVAGDHNAWSTLVNMLFSFSGHKKGDKRSPDRSRPRTYAGVGGYSQGATYGAAPGVFPTAGGASVHGANARHGHKWSD